MPTRTALSALTLTTMLVAKTPRTATCIASETCTLVGLDSGLFEILLELTGPQGEAIRWLLVSSMLMQHNTGTLGIQRQMIRAREARLDDGEITILTASLQGW
jgi:hypothetical protein